LHGRSASSSDGFNSKLYNIIPDQYSYNFDKVIEPSEITDKKLLEVYKKNKENLQNEIKNCVISDVTNIKSVLNFGVNNDNEVVFEYNKDGLEEILSGLKINYKMLENHTMKIDKLKPKEDDLHSNIIDSFHDNNKFVEYDNNKRKTIFPEKKISFKEKRLSMKREYEHDFENNILYNKENDQYKRKSIKHMIHMQNRLSNIGNKNESNAVVEKIKPISKRRSRKE